MRKISYLQTVIRPQEHTKPEGIKKEKKRTRTTEANMKGYTTVVRS